MGQDAAVHPENADQMGRVAGLLVYELVSENQDFRPTSEPTGADVYLDGAFVGNTPLPGFKMSPGAHLLEISSRGFMKWNRSIKVQAGVPTSVYAVLEPSPDQ